VKIQVIIFYVLTP